MSELLTYIQPLALIACLVVGYCLKNLTASQAINDWIPTIMALLGAIITCFSVGWGLENLVAGALTGLASTGLHQAFVRALQGLDKG